MARFGRDGAFQRLPCHEGGIVVAGGSRRSAAPRPRALGRFVDTGWQDSRAVHDSRGPCSGKDPFLARSSRGAFPKGDLRGFSDTRRAYLAKASSFWMHGARILPRTGDFPVRGPFWDAWSAKLATDCRPGTHRGEILPRIVAWERIARAYCHCRMPGNAFCEHFTIGERRGMRQGIILPRLDVRAERSTLHAPTAPVRSTAPNAPSSHAAAPCTATLCIAAPPMLAPNAPAHAPRARRSCPRPARRGTTASCAVRGAFAAAEKVSCGLRVSMRWNEPPVSV